MIMPKRVRWLEDVGVHSSPILRAIGSKALNSSLLSREKRDETPSLKKLIVTQILEVI